MAWLVMILEIAFFTYVRMLEDQLSKHRTPN